MHAGQFATLEEVLEFYSTLANALPMHKGNERLLQPALLTDTEIDELKEFLEALTDIQLPPELLAPPAKPYLED